MPSGSAALSAKNHGPSNTPHLATKPISKGWDLTVRFAMISAFLFIFYWSVIGNVFQPVLLPAQRTIVGFHIRHLLFLFCLLLTLLDFPYRLLNCPLAFMDDQIAGGG
jgi:hypothetical protein